MLLKWFAAIGVTVMACFAISTIVSAEVGTSEISKPADLAIGFMIKLDQAQRFERCPELVHIDKHYYYFSFGKIAENVSTPKFLVLVDRVNKIAIRIEDAQFPLFQGSFIGGKEEW